MRSTELRASRAPLVAVYGGGLVGRAARETLLGLGEVDVRAISARDVPPTDAAELARALAGTTCVIDAAGPLRDTAEPVLVAALAAGAHYVDVGGEQAVLQHLHERHESTARHAGRVALPGAGLDGAIGDLAIAWAAEHLLAGTSGAPRPDGDDDPVRERPTPRLGEAAPLDDATAAYLYDDVAVSAGRQRALLASIGVRPREWQRDRWELAPGGARRRVNAGPPIGERDALVFAGGEPITVPRHLACHHVASYVSTTASPLAGRALGVLARALAFAPPGLGDRFATAPIDPEACARTRFAVVAQVRRGFAAAQVVVRGVDPYRTTGVIAAWAAHALALRATGPVGMRAPAELFAPRPTLRALARLAELELAPSFAT